MINKLYVCNRINKYTNVSWKFYVVNIIFMIFTPLSPLDMCFISFRKSADFLSIYF